MGDDTIGADLSIGQVAGMTRLTIRALRHYDDIGLLRPARVDDSSGYRYYTPDQITVAGTIAVLRGLDIDTTTIAALLAGDIHIDAVIDQEQQRLAKVEQQRRDALEVLGSLFEPAPRPTPMVVDVEAFSILGTHARVPAADDVELVGQAFQQLFTALGEASIDHNPDGMCVVSRSARDELWLDIGVRTTHAYNELKGYEYLEIDAGPSATIIHEGPLSSLSIGHARLAAWVHENGFQPVGSARETYLGPLSDKRTEIALPVSAA